MEPTKITDVFAATEHSEPSNVCNLTEMITNCSNDKSEWNALREITLETIIVPCVFTVILVVGVIGNTLLILSFARHKTLSTPHNALVVNLASGDFIFLIVSLPFNMIWFTLPHWSFGLVICKLSHFAERLATAVVISTLSVLSVERCLIVTGKKLWRQQKRGPILLTIMLWAVSLMVSLPSLISANLVKKVISNETYTFCFLYDESWGNIYSKAHVAFMFIFLFCLPLLVIATAYILIAVHLLLRAFPLRQRNVNTRKPKRKIYLRCFESRKTATNDISHEFDQIATARQVNSSEGKPKDDMMCCKIGPENTNTQQQQTKSRSSKGKDDDNKSCSPDSCTELTEVQQTPVLPYSFVYTGPVPADAITKQEAIYSKLNSSAPETKEKKDSTDLHMPSPLTSSTIPWKETTPLNPSSNSGDAKPRYQQRQQSMVKKRRRLALTVLMLIIAFAVCWTPRHVYLLWYHFLPDNDYDTFWHVFKIIGFCLSSSNSAVNPVVFYILDTTYRSFVHRSLCKLCMKKCRPEKANDGDVVITLGERDYNATIAMSDMKSKGNVAEL